MQKQRARLLQGSGISGSIIIYGVILRHGGAVEFAVRFVITYGAQPVANSILGVVQHDGSRKECLLSPSPAAP